MTVTSTYDKQRVAAYFSRAAGTYTEHDRLQRHVADALLARLQPSVTDAKTVLDVGCGPAHHQRELQRFAERYVGIDLAPAMLREAQHWLAPHGSLVAADMEHLPLTAQCAEVLFSNLAMQWGNDLQQLLREWNRVLKPGAQIAASTVLAGSLQPLGDCFAAIDQRRHTNDWLDFNEFSAIIAALPWQANCEKLVLVQEFPTVEAMLRELKGVGANYTVRSTSGLLGRQRYARLKQALEAQRNHRGMLELHWVIGLVTGFKCVEETAV